MRTKDIKMTIPMKIILIQTHLMREGQLQKRQQYFARLVAVTEQERLQTVSSMPMAAHRGCEMEAEMQSSLEKTLAAAEIVAVPR